MTTPQLKPNDYFVVQSCVPLSDMALQTVLTCYQPIIGAEAYALYMALYGVTLMQREQGLPVRHTELLTQLHTGIFELSEARTRLEGIGLLKTYYQNAHTPYYYELQLPASTTAFFSDVVLGTLLCDSVGVAKYQQLKARYHVALKETHEYTELTAKFADVYLVSQATLAQVMQQTAAPASAARPVPLTVPTPTTFDMDVLQQSMGQGLREEQLFTDAVTEAIRLLHTLYGYDEVTMKQLLLRAYDVSRRKIDVTALREQAVAYALAPTEESAPATTTTALPPNWEQRVAKMTAQGFSAAEQQVVLLCEQLTPSDMLHAVKTKKEGFVTTQELQLLERFLARKVLPPAVLNLLIYYILVQENNVVFGEKFAVFLANDWAQKGVRSPEDARNRILEHAAEREQRVSKRQQAPIRQSGATHVVQLPQWMKNANQPAEQMDEAEQQALRERLKGL